MCMNKIEILKAKVDWWKTWCTTTIILSVTISIAYWGTKAVSKTVANGLAFSGFALLLIYLYFSFMYVSRHKKLIDECKK